ncbi:MAG: hypothetical protein IID16_02040 [Candidatus Marinimicrobia bacterium]|nr:hypothetical protein [Candidatus Neomarinimicrobiota bacterium]
MFKSNFIKDALFDSFVIFLIIGSLVALILGVILFLRPEVIKRTDNFLNSWYSSRKAMKPFEIMRETDSYIYRHNKVVGWIMVIISVFCLYWFIFLFHVEGIASTLTGASEWDIIVDLLLRFGKWFFIIFITFGIPIWILLIFNPEKTKIISEFFNRWISTRLMLMPLEKMYFQIDSFVIKYNKIFGIIIVTASIIILLTIVPIVI